MALKPRKGALAKCSQGAIGIITSETPVEVTYGDGKKGKAWTGFHLEGEKFGQPWSSRKPEVVAYLDELGKTAVLEVKLDTSNVKAAIEDAKKEVLNGVVISKEEAKVAAAVLRSSSYISGENVRLLAEKLEAEAAK